MKKILTVLITMMIIFTSVGCTTEKINGSKDEGPIQENVLTSGVISEITEATLIFENDEFGRVSTNIPEGTEELIVGDAIEVIYTGEVAESYPVQITSITITKIVVDSDPSDERSLSDVVSQ